jgi:gentisate 1,2-dioxygenase
MPIYINETTERIHEINEELERLCFHTDPHSPLTNEFVAMVQESLALVLALAGKFGLTDGVHLDLSGPYAHGEPLTTYGAACQLLRLSSSGHESRAEGFEMLARRERAKVEESTSHG